MKNKLIIVVAIVLMVSAILFCACDGFLNTDYPPIEEGTFVYSEYNVAYDKSKYAKLIITPISEEEFNQANGINVVKDVSPKRTHDYYSVELWYGESQDNCEKAEYIDLKDRNGDPHERGNYFDKNHSWLIICVGEGKTYYNVHYYYDLEEYKSFKADVKKEHTY